MCVFRGIKGFLSPDLRLKPESEQALGFQLHEEQDHGPQGSRMEAGLKQQTSWLPQCLEIPSC